MVHSVARLIIEWFFEDVFLIEDGFRLSFFIFVFVSALVVLVALDIRLEYRHYKR